MSGDNVGDAWVEVHADTSKLSAEARKGAQKAADDAATDIAFGADVDEREVSAEAKSAARRASGSEIDYDTNIDFAELAAKARAAARAAKAEIEVTVQLNERGFKRGSDGLFRDLKGTVATAAILGEALSKPIEKGADIAADAIGEFADKSADALGDLGETAANTSSGIGKSLADLASKGGIGPAIGIVAGLGAALSAAIPFAIALSGAVVALAGAIAEAAFAAAAFAPVLGAVGIAGATLGIAFAGLGESVKAVDKAKTAVAAATAEQAAATKGSKEYTAATKKLATAQAKLDAALAGLGPNTQAFIAGMDRAKDALKGIQGFVRERLFADIGKQLAPLVERWAPQLKSSFGGIAIILNGAARELIGFLKKGSTIKGFQNLVKGLGPILDDVLAAIGPIAKGIGTLFMGLMGPGKELSGIILSLAKRFQGWASAKVKGGGLSKFISGAMETFGNLKDIVVGVGRILVTVLGKGSSDIGKGFLKNIADIVTKFADFLQSKEGQAKLTQWFADAKQAVSDLIAVIKIVAPIVGGILKLMFAFGKSVSELFNEWKGPLQTTANFWGTLFGVIATGVQIVTEGFGGVMGVLSVFWAILKQIGVAIGGFFTGLATGASNAVIGFGDAFANGFFALGGLLQSFFTTIGTAIAGFFTGLVGLAGSIISAVNGAIVGFGDAMGRAFESGYTAVTTFIGNVLSAVAGLAGRIISGAGDLLAAFGRWVAGLAGRAVAAAGDIVRAFSSMASNIISAAGDLLAAFGRWVGGLASRASQAASDIVAEFAGLASDIISGAGDIAAAFSGWVRGAINAAGTAATGIVQQFQGLAGDIVAAIGTIVPHIEMPHIKVPNVVANVITPKKASGGVFSSATPVIVGERGPEAIIPLTRVGVPTDPAVLQLLRTVATSRGIGSGGSGSTGTSGGGGFSGDIIVQLPTGDPEAAAMAVMNRLASSLAS